MQVQDNDNDDILRQDKEEEWKDKVKDGEDESNASVPHLSSTMQRHDNSDFHFGPATLYMIKEENRYVAIPVFFPEHYEYHGNAFQTLNCKDHYCLVKIESKTSDSDESDISRKKSKFFDLGHGHKIQATHTQKLRSTQGISMYSNKVSKFPHLSKEG
eukprot:9441966-Ditylum_brightwellii.AAC.1